MIERISTHKNFTFSERDLLRYLNTVSRFSKTDDEIRATLTYKHAFQKLILHSSLFISFPIKEGAETELNKITPVPAEKIGWLIKEFAEENSPVDTILVNQRNGKPTLQKPLQIKFFGNFDPKHSQKPDLVSFLGKYSTYAPTDVTLIILTENTRSIDVESATKWLENASFPFKEVVLVGKKESRKRNDYMPLKPNH